MVGWNVSVARGGAMSSIRPAAVAGMFYPGEPAALAAEVASYLADADAAGPPPKAIIAPHAGYMYSGAVAGRVYARLKPLAGRIERVVLMGPAHRVYVRCGMVPAPRPFTMMWLEMRCVP